MLNSRTKFLKRLKDLFFKKKENFTGSQYPLGYTTRQNLKYNLEIPYQPVRPILNNVQFSIECLEMATWSYEIRHSISNISRDCFQSIDGRISSWRISEDFQGSKVHKDVKAIAQDLANRQAGKEYILGGNRLKKACMDMLFYGDAFMEMSIEREGINKEYGIANTIYLPSLSTFVEIDEHENIANYIQRQSLYKKQEDKLINPLKILQFSYEKNQAYGMPISLQSLEPWRRLKEASLDLARANRESGNSILKHILPPESDEADREVYQQWHQSQLDDGILTNLYLLPGTEVERIANNSGGIEHMLKHWLQRRYQCIPPGIPLWFFPGLGLESSAGKEISGQPAMNYSRMIAYIRSVLGEQIKYAVSLEIVLKKGYEWYLENGKFDIIWEDWIISEFSQPRGGS